MKRMILTVMTGLMLGLVPLIAPVSAAVPQVIPYQGQLKDAAGTPVNGVVDITFNLYTVPPGGSIWSETHTGVNVSKGLFKVELGSVTPFPVNTFSTPVYLGVTIGTDAEMSPRTALNSAPFALHADDADTVGGFSSSQLDQSAHAADTNNPHSVTAAQTGAEVAGAAAGVQTNLDTHAANASAHHVKTTSFVDMTDTVTDAQIPPLIARDTEILPTVLVNDGSGSGLDADLLDGQNSTAFATATTLTTLQNTVTLLQNTVNSQASLIATLEAKLQYVTVTGTDMFIDGANLHVRSGSRATAGVVNGLGNVIIGYNELRGAGDDRTGSHNLVVGTKLNYSSYGGLVVGDSNTISGIYASVSGGSNNTASGNRSSVSGGLENTASGNRSSVSGGVRSTANGQFSSVSGGRSNTAFADSSAILGGLGNFAGDARMLDPLVGQQSTVGGGTSNIASGLYSSVSGGSNNTASGNRSSVSGGGNNLATGNWASVAGGRYNAASGDYASVSGGGGVNIGDGNIAFANYSAILGGLANLSGDPLKVNQAIGEQSTISGGGGNIASGNLSSVSGGVINKASGNRSAVSGGNNNEASGVYAFVAGGGGATTGNKAFANYSAILGGQLNIAGDPALTDHTIGTTASVSGGVSNRASGRDASVSGGSNNTASGDFSSVGGGINNTVTLAFGTVKDVYSISYYTTSSSATTPVRSFCALRGFFSTDPNVFPSANDCNVVKNGDGTWTLSAGGITSCRAVCFDEL